MPIKGYSTSEVRWVENGASWYVPSMTVLNQCMGGAARIWTVSDSDFRQLKSSLPDAGTMGCPNYPNGTMYKAPYNPDVWLVMNGRSWYVPNNDTVVCWGNWGVVHWVSSGEAVRFRYNYPAAGTATCPLPNGYQYKGSDTTVWVMWNNQRYAVPSMEMYDQCITQRLWSPYQLVSDATRDFWNNFFPYGNAPGWCSHAPRTEGAIAWASGFLGASVLPDGWSTVTACDHFVGLAYGMANSGYTTAYNHWLSLVSRGLAYGDSAVPFGALAFFGPVPGNSAGHVMLSLGNGTFISTGTTVHYAHLADFGNFQGWAWANPEWPGR